MKKSKAVKPAKSQSLEPATTAESLENDNIAGAAESFAAGHLKEGGAGDGEIIIKNGEYWLIDYSKKSRPIRKLSEPEALALGVKLMTRGRLQSMLLERIAPEKTKRAPMDHIEWIERRLDAGETKWAKHAMRGASAKARAMVKEIAGKAGRTELATFLEMIKAGIPVLKKMIADGRMPGKGAR